MENFSLNDLNKALDQIAKYNQDFYYYFGCLKNVGETIREQNKDLQKVLKIDMEKNRNKFLLSIVAHHIKRARFINKDMTVSLESDIKALHNILNYLDEKETDLKQLMNIAKNPVNEKEKQFERENGAKLIINLADLDNHISVAKNYILPKYEAIVKDCKLVQEKLDAKFNELPKELSKDSDYDFKFESTKTA